MPRPLSHTASSEWKRSTPFFVCMEGSCGCQWHVAPQASLCGNSMGVPSVLQAADADVFPAQSPHSNQTCKTQHCCHQITAGLPALLTCWKPCIQQMRALYRRAAATAAPVTELPLTTPTTEAVPPPGAATAITHHGDCWQVGRRTRPERSWSCAGRPAWAPSRPPAPLQQMAMRWVPLPQAAFGLQVDCWRRQAAA
jgi:hypothetical protein